ncbi:MAG: protein kinase [Acidobacteriia bacterium]|nr:protein kinase [Terriglobia bacterium]
MTLAAGHKLGPYEIVAPLGAGGMGEVYRAHDTRLRRDVAIKVLPEAIAPGAWERFEREARAASALNHPHICAVFDIGEEAGRPFLVLELLEGQTLRETIGKQSLDIKRAVSFGAQIAEALEAAHARGIIHRDIKSGNVMVIGQGHVKVLDFGLAKYVVADSEETLTLDLLTAAGTVAGTIHYMAPELLRGSAADVRSDLWALGAVLYEMLSGRLPFQGPTQFAVTAAILHEAIPPLPANVPTGLRAIVARCLAKRPEDRFQNASEVRGALQTLQTAPVPSRKRWYWALGAIPVLALAAFLWQHSQTITPRHLTSTGAPASAIQGANDAFELAMNLNRVQNDIPRAQQVLERAISLDPRFAEALRYHALNYLILILNGYSNDTSLLYKADEELRRAEREAPHLSGIQVARTALYLMQGRKDLVAPEQLDRIIQKEPSNHDAVLWRAILLWLSGANAELKKLIHGVLEREPLMGAARMFLGETLRTEGDLQGAIQEEQRVLEQGPGNISGVRFLALAYMDAGESAKARALLEEKRPAFGKNYMWRLTSALLLARDGRRSDAIQAMDEDTLKFAAVAFSATLDVAEFYAVLGDTPRAIEWLDKAVRNGDERVEWFRRNPRLANIRRDARFEPIIESIEAHRKQRQAH